MCLLYFEHVLALWQRKWCGAGGPHGIAYIMRGDWRTVQVLSKDMLSWSAGMQQRLFANKRVHGAVAEVRISPLVWCCLPGVNACQGCLGHDACILLW